jgi:hypothetical protein
MNTILMATLSVVVYAIVQVADSKVVQKERPNPKAIVRRCVMMFGSVVAGMALYDQFNPLMAQIGDNMGGVGTNGGGVGITQVFTDKPAF